MNEISFYPEICEKFSKYLLCYLPKDSLIAYSYNKFLPQMVNEIECSIGEKSTISSSYIPSLKLDILLGIKIPNKTIRFVLLEVKYGTQLTLADYSQLTGYLQVARKIGIGILFLVRKQSKMNVLSNDFGEIVRMQTLPMEWKMQISHNFHHSFYSGISYYVPNSEIDWVETHDLLGISSFLSLSQKLCADD